jgi:hypothetical protein
MLTNAQTVAAIKAIVQGVTGYGEWMDYWGKLPAWTTSEIKGGAWWNIRRTKVDVVWPPDYAHAEANAELLETTSYELTMHYPWAIEVAGSESEPIFDALVDAVLLAFNSEPNLNGQVLGASLLVYDSGETGFALPTGSETVCHYASFALDIQQVRAI